MESPLARTNPSESFTSHHGAWCFELGITSLRIFKLLWKLKIAKIAYVQCRNIFQKTK